MADGGWYHLVCFLLVCMECQRSSYWTGQTSKGKCVHPELFPWFKEGFLICRAFNLAEWFTDSFDIWTDAALVGWFRGIFTHGGYWFKWCGVHQHGICSSVCCGCFMFLGHALQAYVGLVYWCSGGSILHWWSRGAFVPVKICPFLLLLW